MQSRDILKQAMALKPNERFQIVEGLLKSLDEPNPELDKVWALEAEKRLSAHRSGKRQGIPMSFTGMAETRDR